MIIANIRLRTGDSWIRFDAEPATCKHEWEPHLWDHGDAYCPRCGSLATWVDDPRMTERR